MTLDTPSPPQGKVLLPARRLVDGRPEEKLCGSQDFRLDRVLESLCTGARGLIGKRPWRHELAERGRVGPHNLGGVKLPELAVQLSRRQPVRNLLVRNIRVKRQRMAGGAVEVVNDRQHGRARRSGWRPVRNAFSIPADLIRAVELMTSGTIQPHRKIQRLHGRPAIASAVLRRELGEGERRPSRFQGQAGAQVARVVELDAARAFARSTGVVVNSG